eukprot:TRINITY_DN16603_c0_g1_i1.p1 TRINITY_DN16603_c0_g1~~TRINITY_DN16603_c0_g1_i1.p1  ORF type:complete len:467 (-),score=38.93 TRINITY_DN16603_c0_g1_i1:200-1600(-)
MQALCFLFAAFLCAVLATVQGSGLIDGKKETCMESWRRQYQGIGIFGGIPPGVKGADEVVADCVGRGFVSWSVDDSFLVCLPRYCYPHLCEAAFGATDVNKSGAPVRFDRMIPLRHLRLDFIIAGFSHSGTSTLHNALFEHGSVEMRSTMEEARGELHEFFWKSSFSEESITETFGSLVGNQNKTRGARSTWAVVDSAVMQRLSTIPQLKIIIIIRDPMSQLDSMLTQGFAFISPQVHLAELRVLFPASMMGRNVAPYFPPSRVLLLPFIWLRMAQSEIVDTVLYFLGLPQHTKEQRSWLHRRDPVVRLPGLRQGLCDISANFVAQGKTSRPEFSLPVRSLLHAAFALERVVIRLSLTAHRWPKPHLDTQRCPDDVSPLSREVEVGATAFCAVMEHSVTSMALPKQCSLGADCQRCCFLEFEQCIMKDCCERVAATLYSAALPALREALCGHPYGCSSRVRNFQSP